MNIDTSMEIIATVVTLINFIFLFYIAQKKSYVEEKGKNLATKEDIGEITKEIKAIENKYDSSLERFKMDLMREYEFSKSSFEICNSLDKQLIDILVECQRKIADDSSYDGGGKTGNSLTSIIKLGDFLIDYQVRYSTLPNYKRVAELCSDMFGIYIEIDQTHKSYEETDYSSITSKIKKSIPDMLKIFLPSIDVPTN